MAQHSTNTANQYNFNPLPSILKIIVPSELTSIHYRVTDNLGMMQNTIASFHFDTLVNSQSNFHTPLPAHELFAQSLSSSTSDEAYEHDLSMIMDEKKQRSMISNQESARRSRMRKQKYLDELWSQVNRLRNENHSLIDKLNYVSETHGQVIQENTRLKEEASNLRHMVTMELEIDNPFSTALRELEEVPCNTAYLRAEPTNQSIANSVDLLY